jgi:hypothetical protein
MSQLHPEEPTPPGGSPQYLGYATPRPEAVNLHRIATQQRAINPCILAEIISLVVVCSGSHLVPIAMFAVLIYWIAHIVGVVYAFMLAISLYDTAMGIVLGILTLVPLLGLIVLLIVNGRATRTLRRHGIRVGLLGANPSSIPVDGGV